MRLQPFFLVFDSPPIGLATMLHCLSNLVSRYILVVEPDIQILLICVK